MYFIFQQQIMTGTVTLECFFKQVNGNLVGESNQNGDRQNYQPHITFRFSPDKKEQQSIKGNPGKLIGNSHHY